MFQDAIKSLKEQETVLYVDSAMNFYRLLSEYVQKGSITGYLDTIRVSLNLTKNEVRFIDRQFKVKSHFSWKENMFENGIMASIDSVNRIRLKIKQSLSYKKSVSYFQFSRIIYLRNNTLALFRLAQMYGPSAGYDHLFFYMRQGNEWKRYMKVDLGAW